MNNKILFLIYNGEVKFLSNSDMDHREWFLSLGGKEDEYESLIRGFVMDGKIVFFKGSEFKYDNEVYDVAKKCALKMRQALNDNSLKICCGILPGLPGEKWEPIMTLNEDEIVCVDEVPKKEVSTIDNNITSLYSNGQNQDAIIEFKNDYNDQTFIKMAMKLTIVVLVISVITKIFLIATKKIDTSHFSEILLIISQVVILLGTLNGYRAKKEYTKYLSVVASALLVLSFDFVDVVLGIIYFVFSVDQSILISTKKGLDTIKFEVAKNIKILKNKRK